MSNSPTVAYIGYGALARQIQQLLTEIQSPLASASSIFFDDYAYRDRVKCAYRFSDYLNDQFKDCLFIVAIGYNHLPEKYEVIKQLKQRSRKLVSVLHPCSIISPCAKIDDGVIIFSGCIIEMNSVISSGSILYNGCIVCHDSFIGQCSFLGPRVTIAGRTRVGDRTFLGIGTTVVNDIDCGNDCCIGASSLIQRSIPERTCGVGNPFHITKNIRR